MKAILVYLLLCISTFSLAQKKFDQLAEGNAIRAVLAQQVADWNNFNIEGFMQGYWKSDSLLFIGAKMTHGWDSTLVRYKKSYPTKEAMGVLRFEIIRLQFTSTDACLVTGRYFLQRKTDSPSGVFTLLFRKKSGKWVVVYDHTS
ncbi:MAG: YybH family protein [Cyclobacteriaceae bacterium]|jgi:ketosteroid isomerase-like protein